MRKILLAGVASLALALAPANADEVEVDSKTYDLSAIAVTVSGSVNIGGAIFSAPGLPVTRVVAVDATGTPASLLVAQDFNGDDFAGDPGEPSASGCGAVDLSTSEVPFDPAREVSVFVSTASLDCVGSVATTGVLTLYGLA